MRADSGIHDEICAMQDDDDDDKDHDDEDDENKEHDLNQPVIQDWMLDTPLTPPVVINSDIALRQSTLVLLFNELVFEMEKRQPGFTEAQRKLAKRLLACGTLDELRDAQHLPSLVVAFFAFGMNVNE